MDADQLRDLGFEQSSFSAGGRTRRVFSAGRGPGVVVVHEMPGITKEVAEFGAFLADKGFTVWMPYLFDPPNKELDQLDGWGSTARACLSREFVVFSAGGTSRVTVWLRALAHELHERVGGRGVGLVGMCFSGGFALAAVLEPSVLAPVMSQPSLPFGVTARVRRAPGVSPSDAISAGRRIREEGLCVLGFRFSRDSLSPVTRFARLREMLGDRFEGIEIPSGRGTPFGWTAHSVLTRGRSKHPENPGIVAGVDRLLGFLDERLSPGSRRL